MQGLKYYCFRVGAVFNTLGAGSEQEVPGVSSQTMKGTIEPSSLKKLAFVASASYQPVHWSTVR